MLIPTEEFLTAVITLCRQPEWDAVRRWLMRQHTMQSLRNDNQRDDVLLRMGQGKSQCLAELIKLLTPETATRGLDMLKSESASACANDEALRYSTFY
ncbi:MAG: hypothetical protein L7F77_08050 [Candidatus Magnetominusculus sp. LBB02]|nr:hypothetical protein [Candidatus Magnetominusculus sp. LBB02]